MDAIAEQVGKLAKGADEVERQSILLALRDLAQSIETPRDTMARKNVPMLQIATARVACDLKIYNYLVESEKPLSTDDLVKKTGAASPSFMSRLLRYLASQNDIKEVGKNLFTSNSITETLADPGGAGGIYLFWDSIGPAWAAMPEWLKEHNYADVTSPKDTPHQKGHNTDLLAFDWAAKVVPEVYAHSHQYMKVQHIGLPTWLDVYPYQKAAKSLQPDQIFFIDIGGGIGHQCVELRKKLPDLPNRMIVQDTADTLEQAIKHPGVETVPQDFFKPQALKGAKIYYLRNVIHDHGDEMSTTVLKHTKDVMGPDSVILIDDMVVPNTGAHWHAMSLDFTMMAATAALERTLDQWEALVEKAGLKISNIYTYSPVLRHSIIECVPK